MQLRSADGLPVRVHSKVIALFEGCEPSSSVVLGPAATLLVAKMLASVRGEETCQRFRGVSFNLHHRYFFMGRANHHLPTCSAFSQLRFILDWLSGSGNGSSSPAICGVGPFDV